MNKIIKGEVIRDKDGFPSIWYAVLSLVTVVAVTVYALAVL